MTQIKRALAGTDEDMINLFYVVDKDKTITDVTELGKIITACQNIDVPLGFTILDILTGKVDPDIAIMLDSKLWIDGEIEQLPTVKKKTKKKKENTEVKTNIVEFKVKDKENKNSIDATE
jgi:hypothetical protein